MGSHVNRGYPMGCPMGYHGKSNGFHGKFHGNSDRIHRASHGTSNEIYCVSHGNFHEMHCTLPRDMEVLVVY